MESRETVLMNLSVRQDRDADTENRLVDAAREGEDGTNPDSSTETDISPCGQWEAAA